MLFSITAGIDLSAYATSKTQSDAVNWANAQVGKSLDQDGVYGAQCVDLIRYYYQFLGVSPVRGNGCDYAKNSLPSGWQRIKTYNGFVPQPGDIAVWTYASSSYGHVAIITSADSSRMNVVEQNGSTHITRSHSYSYSYGTFYGVIRPNFASGSGGAKGEMTTPTIHLERINYYVGDTINISWNATSSNTDFYQYWLVIDNKTDGKRYYGGSTGAAGDVNSNHYAFKSAPAGNYYVAVYAVPYNNKDKREKVSTATFNVTTNGMTTPNISINKNAYHIGDTVNISWEATSVNTDFYQYWLIIKNTDNGKEYYGGSTGRAGDVNSNSYRFTVPISGSYMITVYSVPYSSNNKQKVATKKFTAYSEHQYNSGQVIKSPTCSSTGTKKYTCTICGATKTETIAKTSHSYSWKKSGGYVVNSCNNCGNQKLRLPFEDLYGYEHYGDYIAYTSVYNKFITGTNPPEKTLFSPTTPITRAMFVTILYRMAGEPYKNGTPYRTSPFTDITDTSVYYYDAACWALKNGITTETTFKPFENVNREQTASFLFRYAQKNGRLGNSAYKNVNLANYPDFGSVHGWAVEAMKWANFNGMITGTQQGYINPQGATQRIHATKILHGFGKVCNIGNFA